MSQKARILPKEANCSPSEAQKVTFHTKTTAMIHFERPDFHTRLHLWVLLSPAWRWDTQLPTFFSVLSILVGEPSQPKKEMRKGITGGPSQSIKPRPRPETFSPPPSLWAHLCRGVPQLADELVDVLPEVRQSKRESRSPLLGPPDLRG